MPLPLPLPLSLPLPSLVPFIVTDTVAVTVTIGVTGTVAVSMTIGVTFCRYRYGRLYHYPCRNHHRLPLPFTVTGIIAVTGNVAVTDATIFVFIVTVTVVLPGAGKGCRRSARQSAGPARPAQDGAAVHRRPRPLTMLIAVAFRCAALEIDWSNEIGIIVLGRRHRSGT